MTKLKNILLFCLTVVGVMVAVITVPAALYLVWWASAEHHKSMLGIAGVIGIALTVWRGIMLDRQTKTGEERLLRERFATAATLMAKEIAGNPAISARVTGIHIMKELANEYPRQFMMTAFEIFTAYIKDNARITAIPPLPLPSGKIPDKPSMLGADVTAAFRAIGEWSFDYGRGDISPNCFPVYRNLDFSYANFSHLDFCHKDVGDSLGVFNWQGADLSGAKLDLAGLEDRNFEGAIMHGTSLKHARLSEAASLAGAELQGANLECARLRAHTEWVGANLFWACFRKAEIEVAHWGVDCFATDFTDARIKKKPSEEEAKMMAYHVWHSHTRGLEDVKEQSKDHWCLDLCPSTSALVGAFRNFAERPKDKYQDNPSERAKGFRTAAVKLLVDGKLPPDFPRDLRKWIEDDLKPDPDYGEGVM